MAHRISYAADTDPLHGMARDSEGLWGGVGASVEEDRTDRGRPLSLLLSCLAEVAPGGAALETGLDLNGHAAIVTVALYSRVG